MFHRNQGVWISGNLQANAQGLDFTPTKITAPANKPAATWSLGWDQIRDVDFTQGLAMDRISIRHEGGTHALQSARSAAFFKNVMETVRNRDGQDVA